MIKIGDAIEIKVVDIRDDNVRLGINAPREMPVHRGEVYKAIQREHGMVGPGSVTQEVRESAKAQRALEDYFDHARRDLFPKLKESAFMIAISGDPDPKLCLEIGAAIMLDKPILIVCPSGRSVPLALRTIAHKIVEISSPPTPEDQDRITQAARELIEAGNFRAMPPAAEGLEKR